MSVRKTCHLGRPRSSARFSSYISLSYLLLTYSIYACTPVSAADFSASAPRWRECARRALSAESFAVREDARKKPLGRHHQHEPLGGHRRRHRRRRRRYALSLNSACPRRKLSQSRSSLPRAPALQHRPVAGRDGSAGLPCARGGALGSAALGKEWSGIPLANYW